MAMSADDIEAFIEELQRNPQLRDRARNVILADDFLALPGIVARLGERIEQLVEVDRRIEIRLDTLAERLDTLAERLETLTERVDAISIQLNRLTGEFSKLRGDFGNLDGRMFENDYTRHLGNRLSRRFRKVQLLPLSDHDPFFAAWRSGVISEEEWEDAARLDVLALGRDISAPNDPEVVIAMELSKVVDDGDVDRVQRRAAILSKAGVRVIALVDGETIQMGAKALAEARGVIALVQKEAQSA